MKKNYITPETNTTLLRFEENFLTSNRVGNSSSDLSVEDIEDASFWS